jgi:hypothetical protein
VQLDVGADPLGDAFRESLLDHRDRLELSAARAGVGLIRRAWGGSPRQ